MAEIDGGGVAWKVAGTIQTLEACDPGADVVSGVNGKADWKPITASRWRFPGNEVVLARTGPARPGPRRPNEYAVVTKGPSFGNVTVDAQGQVLAADIMRSSGSAILDRYAIAIVKAAAPFGEFTTAMRRSADQLVITSRFRFTRDEGLATSVSAR